MAYRDCKATSKVHETLQKQSFAVEIASMHENVVDASLQVIGAP